MALPSLSRGFPSGVLRQASPAAGFRLMGTRCQTVDMPSAEPLTTQDGARIACLDSERDTCSGLRTPQLLRQQFTDLQDKTSRDLERLMKSANNLRKAGNAFLGATILGVPLLLVVGSKDQA